MEKIPQSVTKRIPLKCYLATDHISPGTGLTVAVVISKNGAAFGNPSGGATNATEIGNGWYYFDASTTDTGTTGPLIVRGTSATIDPSETTYNVASATTADFPALIVASVSGAVGSVTGAVGSVTGAVGSVTGNVGGNVTGTVGSVVGAVGSVTGNVGGNVVGSVASVSGNVGGNVVGSAASVVGAVGSVTGNVGGNVTGSVGSVTGLTASNLDTTVSSRASAASLVTAQADLDDIQTRLPAALIGGRMNASTEAINGVEVQGAGVLGDEWRPV